MILAKCIYSKAQYFTVGAHYPILEKFKERIITINDIGKKTCVKYTGNGSRLNFDFPKTGPSTELNMAAVVQQRELLLAFHRTLVDDFTQKHEYYTREQIVDDFLKSQQ